MNPDELLTDLRERFGEAISLTERTSPKRLFVTVDPARLLEICRHFFKVLGFRFNIASAIDSPKAIEVLYHFTSHPTNLMVTIKVLLDRSRPRIASLTPMMPAADWIEREIRELFGVEFDGHPDPRRLLLPEQWPEGVHPLRRDYQEWDPSAIRSRGVE